MSVWPPPPEHQPHQPAERPPQGTRLGYAALAASGVAVLLFAGQPLLRSVQPAVQIATGGLVVAGLILGLTARRSWAGKLALVVPVLMFCRFLYFLFLWYRTPHA